MMVYAFGSEEGNPVKVGVSENPLVRISQVQNGHPFKLHIIKAWQHDLAHHVEQRAHKLLKAYRLRGEWFTVDFETAIVAVELAIIEVDAEVVPKIQAIGDAAQAEEPAHPTGWGSF